MRTANIALKQLFQYRITTGLIVIENLFPHHNVLDWSVTIYFKWSSSLFTAITCAEAETAPIGNEHNIIICLLMGSRSTPLKARSTVRRIDRQNHKESERETIIEWTVQSSSYCDGSIITYLDAPRS